MKPGDQVNVSNYRDDSYQVMTVLEVTEESVKLKHPDIGGFFMVSKELVHSIEE
jgi:hypothetical protein